ncbi:MAG: hypothetical protein WB755_13510, partial [Terriglobales bacterium]
SGAGDELALFLFRRAGHRQCGDAITGFPVALKFAQENSKRLQLEKDTVQDRVLVSRRRMPPYFRRI